MCFTCPKFFLSDKEVLDWVSRSVVARVLNGEYILLLQQKIKDTSFENVRVIIQMGGDNVFLTCSGKENIIIITSEAFEFFNLFFSGLHPWSKNNDVNYERGV